METELVLTTDPLLRKRWKGSMSQDRAIAVTRAIQLTNETIAASLTTKTSRRQVHLYHGCEKDLASCEFGWTRGAISVGFWYIRLPEPTQNTTRHFSKGDGDALQRVVSSKVADLAVRLCRSCPTCQNVKETVKKREN